MIIEKLTSVNLEKACDLADKVFPRKETPPHVAIEASLDPAKGEQFKKSLYEDMNTKLIDFEYWAAIDQVSDSIMGLIGLYTIDEDETDTNWISWFCVAREFRNRGVGSKLLNFAIKTTKDEGKPYVRMFTSNDPNESAAQILYEKNNFKIIEEKGRIKRNNFETFYRELKL